VPSPPPTDGAGAWRCWACADDAALLRVDAIVAQRAVDPAEAAPGPGASCVRPALAAVAAATAGAPVAEPAAPAPAPTAPTRSLRTETWSALRKKKLKAKPLGPAARRAALAVPQTPRLAPSPPVLAALAAQYPAPWDKGSTPSPAAAAPPSALPTLPARPPPPGVAPPPTDLEYLVTFKDKAPIHAVWVPATVLRRSAFRAGARFGAPLRRRLDDWADAVGPVRGPPGVPTVAPDMWEDWGECSDGEGGGGAPHAAVVAPPSRLPGLPDDAVSVGRALATDAADRFLIKWRGLRHDAATWEPRGVVVAAPGGADALAALAARAPIAARAASLRVEAPPQPRGRGARFKASPAFLGGGRGSGRGARGGARPSPPLLLRDYQLDGLNWLLATRAAGDHAILADEMGLGKTVQAAAYAATVSLADASPRPHLIVVPLSTADNWVRELEAWAPQMVVVALVGARAARRVVLEHELCAPPPPPAPARGRRGRVAPAPEPAPAPSDREATVTADSDGAPAPRGGRAPPPLAQARVRVHVVVATYETAIAEMDALASLRWASLVVDEAHRVRSPASSLARALARVRADHRVALTGTPLQNSLDDLDGLLEFLGLGRGAVARAGSDPAAVRALLAPRLLRRLKRDAAPDLPPKRDAVLVVEMSAQQKALYRATLESNAAALAAAGGGRRASLRNVLLQLRKVCCHPFLLDGAEEAAAAEAAAAGDAPPTAADRLVAAAGKLALLDRMVARLVLDNHRVLICSQFKGCLDLLERWASARSLRATRLDGDTPGPARQAMVDAFNAEPPTLHLLLASTRAGGLGLNVVGADTVVLYDADWNPHADAQAASRVHRIGQAKPVMVYRLVTRATVEERMAAAASRKLALARAALAGGPATVGAGDLDDVLRHGVRELFGGGGEGAGAGGATAPAATATAPPAGTLRAQETAAGRTGGDDGRRVVWDEAALDAALDRSAAGVDADDGGAADGILGEFKTARFETDDDEDGNGDDSALAQRRSSGSGAAFWAALLAPALAANAAADAASLGKGKRAKRKVDYDEGAGAGGGEGDARGGLRARSATPSCPESDAPPAAAAVRGLGNGAGLPAPARARARAPAPPPPSWLDGAIVPTPGGGYTAFGAPPPVRALVRHVLEVRGAAGLEEVARGGDAVAARYAAALARLLSDPPNPAAATLLATLLDGAGDAGRLREQCGALAAVRGMCRDAVAATQAAAAQAAAAGQPAPSVKLTTPGAPGADLLAAPTPAGWAHRHDVRVAGALATRGADWDALLHERGVADDDLALAAEAAGAATGLGARGWLTARARVLASAAALDAARKANPRRAHAGLVAEALRGRGAHVAWAVAQPSLEGLAAALGVE
jgi:superfamily II DNA or RNA helicase